jgi:hypothetical protein
MFLKICQKIDLFLPSTEQCHEFYIHLLTRVSLNREPITARDTGQLMCGSILSVFHVVGVGNRQPYRELNPLRIQYRFIR